MGDRAVVTWAKWDRYGTPNDIGVYFHWSGGLPVIKALLEYCRRSDFREPDQDDYGLARFIQVACNYYSDKYGLSVGVNFLKNLDLEGDYGTFVCKGWDIVGRKHSYSDNIETDFDIEKIIIDIDRTMPPDMRLETKR